MSNPYETLDVPKDATEDEIKQAYRRKSREHHPDRGGNGASMALVNVAYDTLSDPERRRRYDESGEMGRANTLDERARHAAFSVMGQIIDKVDTTVDVIDQLRKHFELEIRKAKKQLVGLGEMERRLAKHRKRLRDGDLFDGVFRQKELGIRNSIQGLEQNIEMFERVIEMIADCSYESDPRQAQAVFVTTGTGTSTWSG